MLSVWGGVQVGLGALKVREGAPPPPTDDKAPLKAVGAGEGLAYKKLAQDTADHQICIDLFLLTQVLTSLTESHRL
jgi:hypothetical protein